MSERIEVKLPKLGESIVGATIVKWLKTEGDHINLDEPLVEVSTDKVNSEIPSPYAGTLQEILAVENQEILVGDPLAAILVGEIGEISSPAEEKKESPQQQGNQKDKSDFFSPAVMRLAQVEGISIETLRKIEGTGEGGRVSKRDIENYLESQKSKKAPCPLKSNDKEERVKLTGMRKAIADNMVRSFYEAPHASLVTKVDVTDVMRLITREKEVFFASHGVKLTITSFLIQALAKAIQQYPALNASLEGETIVMKRYVNVGVAVHIDQGLVVPVIKNCQDRNLVSIAKEVSGLSTKARSGKLAPDDVQGGSITLTNFGMTGALIGVPIIRYPEVAIIGAGTIKKEVAVRDDDTFAIRQMMHVTLTFDHRVIDGIYGCEFLSALKQNLESISVH
jgi:2-oxoglutarate dehydrogenase E2 component (dihydrolipoamide succinyltransferase)